MKTSRLCFATILLLSASTAVAGPALKTARGDLLVSNTEGMSFVQRADGQRVALPLPKGSRVSDLRTAATDWYAAAVSHDSGRPQIRLFKSLDSDLITLPAPAVAPVKEINQPIFVADKTGIRGLVWLAGDAHHQHAVQAARWINGSWGQTETISPPGKGTQIALSTAVLGDDSWLVVWAAFDGQDDEILWSRTTAEGWSKPQSIAVDNSVPDITPSLYPTADGALVAWSRYDGHAYRVNVARFDGTTWSQPRLAGPSGSTAAVFSDANEPYLIYRRPAEGAWAVMALDPTGSVHHEASIAVPDTRRPVLANVTREAVTLEWPSIEKQGVSAPLPWIAR